MTKPALMPWMCPKCYGARKIRRFAHRKDGGRCFRCQGTGRVLIPRTSLFKPGS